MTTPLSRPEFAGSGFHTTRWSLVVAAADGSANPRARQALTDLCRLYWYPLYAYIRRRGHAHAEAEDLTQDFFASLLEKNALAAVEPSRGRFRSFLLTACQHFLANAWDRARARKRGGGKHLLSLDLGDAENRYEREPSHEETAERLFERRWVLTLLQEVLRKLRVEFEQAGKADLFEAIKGSLTGQADRSHAQIGEEQGMSEGAVKVAVHRLRRRYRELLREEIRETVSTQEQIDEEIRSLFTVLGE